VGPRTSRAVLVSAAAAALVVATVAPSAAQDAGDAPAGSGVSSGATSVLNLVLGSDALRLRLIGEDSLTSNDPASNGPLAVERVSPLQVTSTLLPALSAASQPSVESRSTSGTDSAATPGVDLGTLLGGTPVPGLLSGVIDPVALQSLVDAGGATSGARAAVHDLAVLGGLLQLDNVTANLGSGALVTDANAVRGLQLDSLQVLDLGALLDALGISLSDLPLDAAVGLLDQLGLPLPGGLGSPAEVLATIQGLLSQTGAVRVQVTALQGQVDGLEAQLAPLTSQLAAANAQVTSLSSQLAAQQALLAACVVPALCAPIQALVTSLTSQVATAQSAVNAIQDDIGDLNGLIDDLLDQVDALLAPVLGLIGQLTDLLDGILAGLDGASLLSVSDLVVGVTARADDTVATSVASIVGSVGDVRVGALSLGGLDLGATLGQVTALTDQVTGALGSVLATIDPSLAGLVDIDLLQQTTSITEADGVTTALAGITGLRATVTPPDICGLLDQLGAQETVGSLLDSVGALVPALPGPVGAVLGDLGSTVTCTAAAAGSVSTAALVDGVASALTQPLTVEALSVYGTGSFAVPFAPGSPSTPGSPTTPGGSLPNTGGQAWLALAVVLGAAGYGARRVLVRTG
jgi:hypothetical protein